MNNLYRYYLNFGTGLEEINIVNNSLKIVHRRNEKFFGIIDYLLEGSFGIVGANFQRALDTFIIQGSLDISIYDNDGVLGGNELFAGIIEDFPDIDSNENLIKFKSFSYTGTNNNSIRFYENKKIRNVGSSVTIKNSTNTYTVTAKAGKLISILENFRIPLDIFESFTASDCWYGTELVDLDKLYIAPLSTVTKDSGGTLIGGTTKQVTYGELIRIIENLFNVKLTIDNSEMKFKKIEELYLNTLDLSSELVKMKNKSYDPNKLFSRQLIRLSENSTVSTESDWFNVSIDYPYTGAVNEIEMDSFSTWWGFSDDLNSDGYLLMWINDSTKLLESTTGYISGVAKENGYLSPANILHTFYNDFIYTDKPFYSIGGVLQSKPTHFNTFIQLPQIQTVIADPTTFYDSILVEVDESDNERIGLVVEQSTDLNTNITTFTAFEFINELNNVMS